MRSSIEYNAIIVAGGRATRLGGIDKTALLFDGRTLLQCALDAVRDAIEIALVGVGVQAPPTPGLRHTSEQPRWGGPAAALSAGVHNLRLSRVEATVVIAADMPRVAGGVALLLDAFAVNPDFDGVIAVDSSGRRQYLLGVYRTAALRRAVAAAGSLDGAAVRTVIGALVLREVVMPDEYCADVDTPADAVANGIELRTRVTAG